MSRLKSRRATGTIAVCSGRISHHFRTAAQERAKGSSGKSQQKGAVIFMATKVKRVDSVESLRAKLAEMRKAQAIYATFT